MNDLKPTKKIPSHSFWLILWIVGLWRVWAHYCCRIYPKLYVLDNLSVAQLSISNAKYEYTNSWWLKKNLQWRKYSNIHNDSLNEQKSERNLWLRHIPNIKMFRITYCFICSFSRLNLVQNMEQIILNGTKRLQWTFRSVRNIWINSQEKLKVWTIRIILKQSVASQ